MRNIFTSIAFLFTLLVVAQPPANYYSTATGTGYTLKTQLFNIIKDHDDKGYGGLYTTYQTSDRDYFYENDGTILDIYSERPTATDPYTYSATASGDRCGNYNSEGDCFNREHIVPQSVFNSQSPMYADAHFVIPTDGYVNGIRSNLPFGRVGSANYTSMNGSKRGSNVNSGYSAGYSGTVFEPIDEFKGDVARMFFYFATRYQNKVASWSFPMFNGTSNQVFTVSAINILLTWHLQDPVSPREIARNNAIYARQNNRNPFIDHPEYAMMIWGSLLSTETPDYLESIAVFPNPSSDGVINIATPASIQQIDVVSITGQVVKSVQNPENVDNVYVVDGLPSGLYIMQITSGSSKTNKKILVY